jgi:hypothetical protein
MSIALFFSLKLFSAYRKNLDTTVSPYVLNIKILKNLCSSLNIEKNIFTARIQDLFSILNLQV